MSLLVDGRSLVSDSPWMAFARAALVRVMVEPDIETSMLVHSSCGQARLTSTGRSFKKYVQPPCNSSRHPAQPMTEKDGAGGRNRTTTDH